jgi:pimeloyl-ACP methyl ester carboxylesterase
VFLHGLTMDGSVWRHVVAGLRGDYRCVLPTLPLGGHRRPMHAGADLDHAALDPPICMPSAAGLSMPVASRSRVLCACRGLTATVERHRPLA